MRNSFLLNEILKGEWAISLSAGMAHQSILFDLLSKNYDLSLQDVDRDPLQLSIQAGSSEESVSADEDIDDIPENSIIKIPVKGTMLKYGTWCSYGTTELAQTLIKLGSHKNVIGAVLDNDSGGGALGSIAPMTSAITHVKSLGKPVVASVDTCGSANYWMATECDEIIANNDISASAGSIGILANWWDYTKYYENKGIKLHIVYPPESEHKNEGFRKASEGDYATIIKEDLSPLAIQFQNQVKAKRGDKLKAYELGVLTGKMFHANDALEVGLIDSIGNENTAYEAVRRIAHDRAIKNYIK